MMRSCTMFALVAALLVLAAAQDVDTKPQDETKTSPLTAIQLPSESIFRAARSAVRAARALAGNMPSSFNLSTNMVQTLAVAGAVVVGLIGAVGILALILPMFGFRMCYLFGTCDASYAHAFLAPTAYDAYAYSQPVYANAAYAKSYDGATNELPYSYEAYPQHAQVAATYPTSNSVVANAYQKRSLEYVGPILKMLSNAYEKYNHPSQAKSVAENTKSTVSSVSAETQAE